MTPYDVSIQHNSHAHNADRNSRIKTAGVPDIVNNVIYDDGSTGSSGWGPSHVSDEDGTPLDLRAL